MQKPKRDPGAVLAKALPFLTMLCAFLYALFAYMTLLAPKIARLRSGGEFDLVPFQARLVDERSYAAQVTQAVTAYGAVDSSTRSRVENIATDSPDVPGLFVQLDRIATANGFQLDTIDALPDAKAVASGERRIVEISVNIKGGEYAQFKRLLLDMERSERILDVRSVIFTPATGSYSLQLRAYYVDPFAPSEPLPGAVPSVAPMTP